MNFSGYLVCILVVACLGLWLALNIEQSRTKALDAGIGNLRDDNERLLAASKERDLLQAKIAKIDRDNTVALRAANDEIETLRAAARAGAVRVSVHATCPQLPETTASSGMGDDAGPELTAGAHEHYFDLRNGIARVSCQLSACQQYAAAVAGSQIPPLQSCGKDMEGRHGS